MGLVPCYFAFFSLSTQAGRIQTTIMRTIFEGRGQSGAVAAVEAARMTARKKKRKRRHGAVAAVAGGVQLFDFISRLLLEADAARGGNIVERRKKGCLSLSLALVQDAQSLRERHAGEFKSALQREMCFFADPTFFFSSFFSLFTVTHSFDLLRETIRLPSLSLFLSVPGMASPAAAGAIASSSSSSSPSSRNANRSSSSSSSNKRAANYLPLPIISSSLESLPVPFLLVGALVASSLAPHAARSLARIARLLKRAIDWAFGDEFEPWLKWTILDACLAVCAGLAAKKVRAARPALRALGWI